MIMQELAKYRDAIAYAERPRTGRLGSSSDRGLAAGYAPVTAIVAVLEDFCAATLAERVEKVIVGVARVNEDAQTELVRIIERSWADRRAALKRWLGADMA